MEQTIDQSKYRALLESEVPTLSDYSISFSLPTFDTGPVDAMLGGSGTLVTIDQVHGILTANHVIKLLGDSKFVGLILPSRFEATAHNLMLQMQYCDRIVFRGQGKLSEGPDLGLLIPPSDVLSILRAKKSFYNLSQRRNRLLEKLPPIDHGFWMLLGCAAEWTIDCPPEQGFSRVKGFRGLHGAGVVTKEYDRGKFDYLIFEALYNEYYEGPDSYEGFSGGGLWQMLAKPIGENWQVTDRILSGVAFHQSEKKHIAGQITRDITCHGRKSLYQVLVDKARSS